MHFSDDGWLIIKHGRKVVGGIPAKEVARVARRIKAEGVPWYNAALTVPITRDEASFITKNTMVVLLSDVSKMQIFH